MIRRDESCCGGAKANNQLEEIATAANIPLPDALASDDQAMREQLDKLQADAFDRDCIQGQITAHQQAVQLFEHKIGSGQDSWLKKFASQSCPS